MLEILCILMQKNFCSLFTFPVFGTGSVYTLFAEKHRIHLTTRDAKSSIYKKDGCRPFGRPPNWVPELTVQWTVTLRPELLGRQKDFAITNGDLGRYPKNPQVFSKKT